MRDAACVVRVSTRAPGGAARGSDQAIVGADVRAASRKPQEA